MRTRSPLTLPSIHSAATWSHPYPAGVFSPVWYADGTAGGADTAGTDDAASDTDDSSDATDDAGTDTKDWKAEADKYRALQKKWEARAKENAAAAKERDDLRKQSMTDQEKAVDEASAKARAEERVRLAGKLARQGFLAAAAGRLDNAGDVADDLNLAKFVGEDGEVDEAGLKELVDRLAPKPEKESDKDDTGGEGKQRTNGRGFDQGARGGGTGKENSVAAGRDLYAERKKKATIS